MSLFAIALALLLEQVRPLLPGNQVQAGYGAWLVSVRHHFDTGRQHHGWLVWTLALGVPGALVLGISWLLRELAWPLELLWYVVVLYFSLGLRQSSQQVTRIRDALYEGDEAMARQALAQWQGADAHTMAQGDVPRQAVQHAVRAAHRQVFGVLFWFAALAAVGLGPLGAVLYRMGARLAHVEPAASPLRQAACRAWQVLDWLPARLSALSFAMVGNFEDAMEAWRFYAYRFGSANSDGILLAAALGALHVRLDDGAHAVQKTDEAPPAHPDHLRTVMALVWRAVAVWLLLLALLMLTRLLG